MQKQSMKQQYKRDTDLTEEENELLQRYLMLSCFFSLK
jgi:hypothetical protein